VKPNHVCRRVAVCTSLLFLIGVTAADPNTGRAADDEKPAFKVTPAKISELKVNLRSIKPIDADAKCVLVGDKGTVARSEDGGKSWRVMKTGSSADLFDVRFRTDLLGVAVGEGGDYPAPQEKAPPGIYIILKDKYIMDGGHVWSSILRTTDGGKKWTRIEAPTNMTLNGVSWLDDKKVIAIMSDLKAEKPRSGGFCTSEDAGLTWKVFYHLGAPCKAITIGPDRTGWVVGYPTVGDTKILLPGKPPKGFKDLTEADRKELTADIIRGLSLPAGIKATSFSLGAKAGAPLIRDKVIADGLVIEDTEVVNHATMMKDRAYAVGEKGYLAVSERKNKKWEDFQKVDLGEKEVGNLNGVSFRDENTGMVVGDGGICLYTIDGAKTWKRLDTGTEKNLRNVNFVGKKHCVIVGDEGTVLHVTKNEDEK
jgi:photosystem II stability/assembly factor-like uncharacterized protein